MGDSQARGIVSILKTMVLFNVKITATVCPNATLNEVVDIATPHLASLLPTDVLIILAGTNDTSSPNSLYRRNYNEALTKLKIMGTNKNVFIWEIPPRYDDPLAQKRTDELNEILTRASDRLLFRPSYSREWFSKHGLHLSTQGKVAVCRELLKLITKNYTTHQEQTSTDLRRSLKECDQIVPALLTTSRLNPRERSHLRYYTDATFGGIMVKCLIDSGSTHTFLDSRFWELLVKKRVKLFPAHAEVVLADSSKVEITGHCTIPIMVGKNSAVMKVLLMKNLPQDAIIGTDALKELKAVLNFRYSTMTCTQNNSTSYVPIIECSSITASLKESVDPLNSSDLLDVDTDHLTEVQVAEAKQFLSRWYKDFLGTTGFSDLVQHEISLKDPSAPPFRVAYFNTDPKKEEFIHQQVLQWEKDKIIEPSVSPYNSPLLLVPKGPTYRLVIDFRKLNSNTRPFFFPIPNVEFILSSLRDAKYVSTLDLRSGFLQLAMAPDSKQYTAFSCRGQHYQFRVQPYGLLNSSAYFQLFVNQVLQDLLYDQVLVYIDDIIAYSSSYESHMALLDEVFKRLRKANLKIAWEKSHFFRKYVKYLGHLVGQGEVKVEPEKTAAIQRFPVPQTLKQVRQFLGLCSYYRKFVPHFAEVSKPLTKLLKKNQQFHWNQEAEISFNKLKQALIEATELYTVDWQSPFYLATDASQIAHAGVLFQIKDKVECPIAFYSKTFTEVEQNYATTDLEMLALIRALENFRPYVEGRHVICFTDHSAITWIMRQPKLKPRLMRYVLRLTAFDVEIKHRPGTQMVPVDTLSRSFPQVSSAYIPPPLPTWTNILDPWYKDLCEKVKTQPQEYPEYRYQEPYLFKTLSDQQECLYVPMDYRVLITREHHSTLNGIHSGIRNTVERLSRNYYWPNMKAEIRDFIRRCPECQMSKPDNRLPYGHMKIKPPTLQPGRIWYLDHIGALPTTKGRNRYALVAIDSFSKYTVTAASRALNAGSTIKILLKDIILKFGLPSLIVTDNHSVFKGKEFSEFCQNYNISHHMIPLYQANVNLSERRNRDIKIALRAFASQRHDDWDIHLPFITFCLNSTVSETTQVSPHELVFNFIPRSLFEIYDPVANGNLTVDPPTQVIQEKRNRLTQLLKNINKNIRKAKVHQAHNYNLRHSTTVFNVHDLVLRRNHIISDKFKKITQKLAPLYIGPFRITKKLSNTQFLLETIQGKPAGLWEISQLKPFLKTSPEI